MHRHGKVKLSEIEIDLDILEALGARLITLLELGIVIVVSYFVSGWIFGLINSTNLGSTYAYIGQIISFFVILLIGSVAITGQRASFSPCCMTGHAGEQV